MALSSFVRALKSGFASQPKVKERLRFRPRLESLEDRMAPAIFAVTTTADAGVGSLRQAIIDANTLAGADTINFNIAGAGVKSIALLSPLPTLTGTATIAGNTQPGFGAVPLIELNGTSAGAGANGLTMKAAGSVVRALVINRFQGNGILALGSNGVVEGCYIGTSSTGATALANKFYGVLIAGAATNVRIGGTTTAPRNIISGNSLSGVAILGALTSANKVQGNFIGTDVGGNVDLGNTFDGVLISGGSKNNVIGGTVPAARNAISGNGAHGVEISGAGTTGNKVQGNSVGLNAFANTALGNSGDGIHVAAGAKTNVIGGTVSGARNIISTNTGSGVTLTDVGTSGNFVQGNAFGTNDVGFNLALGNNIGVLISAGAAANVIGGTVAGTLNVINSSATAGVRITGAGTAGNKLQGNIIGLRLNGSAARSNNIGVEISAGATGNIVGGTAAGARNVISGNSTAGVQIAGAGTASNLVQGNFIGTGLTGAQSFANDFGVLIDNTAGNNTVGGTVAGARNVIAGNTNIGVEIAGGSGNLVQGNFIGINAAGTAALGNLFGVELTGGATNNLIGGTTAAARNVVSGNVARGIQVDGSTSNGNKIQGNFIGTNAAGSAAVPNNIGVIVFLAQNNLVGGAVAGARNVIAGNNGVGVEIDQAPNANTIVQGNFIGLNAAGAILGNGGSGIRVAGGAGDVVIGGVTPLARNVISGNAKAGIEIGDPLAANGVIQGNFIGTRPDGIAPAGNILHGVIIYAGAHDNRIGGTVAGAGNRIAFNGGDGVLVGSDPAFGGADAGSGNSVLGNRIFNNAGQGIDLGANDGPTANDNNDPDVGPNNVLNTPTLTSAFLSGTSLLITGFINTEINKVLRIEFFSSPSGGQGQTFLGFQNVSMGPNNTIIFTKTLTVPASVLAGQKLTATITDELGNTSEFSIPLTIE